MIFLFVKSTFKSVNNFSFAKKNILIIKSSSKHIMSKTNDIGCTISEQNEGYTDEKLISPAATRNKDVILQVLKRFIICDTDPIGGESPLFLEISSGTGQHVAYFAPHFPGVKFQPSEVDKSESPFLLEVASGTGQHVSHFAPHFPGVKFQPSEVETTLFKSISLYAANCPTKNILPPMLIDIQNKFSQYGFEENSIDYMFNANMMHIAPFECTIGLFQNAGAYLKPEALMITYGPYSKDGVITPESNVSFHAVLKQKNPLWGIRDINDLIKLGIENNLSLIDTVEMPSNNMTLIWKKN